MLHAASRVRQNTILGQSVDFSGRRQYKVISISARPARWNAWNKFVLQLLGWPGESGKAI